MPSTHRSLSSSTVVRSFTPWPVVWTNMVRSQHEVARANARSAMQVLTARRLEREDVERTLRELEERRSRARRSG
jgi:hypothetical protein